MFYIKRKKTINKNTIRCNKTMWRTKKQSRKNHQCEFQKKKKKKSHAVPFGKRGGPHLCDVNCQTFEDPFLKVVTIE